VTLTSGVALVTFVSEMAAMTTKPTDDLEAVRILVSTLEAFDPRDRERIIRWAREKLGMTAPGASSDVTASAAVAGVSPGSSASSPSTAQRDIRTFVAQKQPKSDLQFAATIAYYYQFEAPPQERKDAISKEDLVEACRKVDRKRPAAPSQVLVNAYHAGLFDRGDRGVYRLNSVGENLVAMVLPDGAGAAAGNGAGVRVRMRRKESRASPPAVNRRRAKRS
jgi:hypothetical protein